MKRDAFFFFFFFFGGGRGEGRGGRAVTSGGCEVSHVSIYICARCNADKLNVCM